MDLIRYFKLALSRYADFSGRSTRPEFWWFQLAYFALFIAINFITFILVDTLPGMLASTVSLIVVAIVFLVLVFGLLLPQLSITVRRLHDTGKSGWYMLFSIIPYLGTIIVIILCCQATEPHTNKCGPVPGSEDRNALENTLIDFGDDII